MSAAQRLSRHSFEAQKSKENEEAQQRAADAISGRRFQSTPAYFAEVRRREEEEGHDYIQARASSTCTGTAWREAALAGCSLACSSSQMCKLLNQCLGCAAKSLPEAHAFSLVGARISSYQANPGLPVLNPQSSCAWQRSRPCARRGPCWHRIHLGTLLLDSQINTIS